MSRSGRDRGEVGGGVEVKAEYIPYFLWNMKYGILNMKYEICHMLAMSEGIKYL
jgi:hypothetical protein